MKLRNPEYAAYLAQRRRTGKTITIYAKAV